MPASDFTMPPPVFMSVELTVRLPSCGTGSKRCWSSPPAGVNAGVAASQDKDAAGVENGADRQGIGRWRAGWSTAASRRRRASDSDAVAAATCRGAIDSRSRRSRAAVDEQARGQFGRGERTEEVRCRVLGDEAGADAGDGGVTEQVGRMAMVTVPLAPVPEPVGALRVSPEVEVGLARTGRCRDAADEARHSHAAIGERAWWSASATGPRWPGG